MSAEQAFAQIAEWRLGTPDGWRPAPAQHVQRDLVRRFGARGRKPTPQSGAASWYPAAADRLAPASRGWKLTHPGPQTVEPDAAESFPASRMIRAVGESCGDGRRRRA